MSVSLALAITTGSGLAQNQSPDTATASATQDTTPRAGLVVSTPGQGAVSGNVVRRLVCLSVLIALAPAFMNAQNSGGAPGAVVEFRPGLFSTSPPEGLTVAGNPQVIDSPFGKAAQFDGKDDGYFLPVNPLEGLSEFTLEAVFRPDGDGPAEQRFVHFGQVMGDRVLLETRVANGQWHLDTFIAGGGPGRPMIDPKLVHPTDRWYHVAFVVRNGRLSNYVNGVLELEGQVPYTPMKGGAASIGVRLNRQSWFKGAIYSVRITPRALAPGEFTLSKPQAE
ncbi:MAG: LamG domain-containing protein [bacterium]|jgi:hypothetical protein